MKSTDERLSDLEARVPSSALPKSRGALSSEFKTTALVLAAGALMVALGAYLTVNEDKETGHMLIQEGMPMLTILATVYAAGRTAVKVAQKKE